MGKIISNDDGTQSDNAQDMIEMPEMDLTDVVEVARVFTTLAGWGYFRLQKIKHDEETNIWKLTAYVGAYNNQLMEFGIDDSEREVVSYGDADESNNQ